MLEGVKQARRSAHDFWREPAPATLHTEDMNQNLMHLGLAFLMTSLLAGQGHKDAPSVLPGPALRHLKLPGMFSTPQETFLAMAAEDRAWRKASSATVEVIGHDDVAALKLVSARVSEQVRREFRPMDSLGNLELYAFMHQDPSNPSPVPNVPRLWSGAESDSDSKWLASH